MREFFSKKLQANNNHLEVVELRKSYRSSKAILSFVNKVLDDGGGTGIHNVNDHISYYEDFPGRVELWPILTEKGRDRSKSWWNFEEEPIHDLGVEILAENIAVEIKNILESEKKIFNPNKGNGNLVQKISPGDFLILVRSRGSLFTAILKK